MAALVVESSAWIAYLKGEENSFLEMGLEAMAVQIPPLVLTELLGNAIPNKDKTVLENFLQKIPLSPINNEHFAKAASLKSALAARGFSISARDAHITQCALDQNAILLTKDIFFLDVAKYCGVKVQV